MGTYITSQGDTWDMISYKVYGSEKYVGLLMQNNFELLDIFQFSSGVEVYIPEITEDDTQDLPNWR
ncbi:MAG: tail protein X [Velocimicrobium sp.]